MRESVPRQAYPSPWIATIVVICFYLFVAWAGMLVPMLFYLYGRYMGMCHGCVVPNL
jgi:hypothetical protein